MGKGDWKDELGWDDNDDFSGSEDEEELRRAQEEKKKQEELKKKKKAEEERKKSEKKRAEEEKRKKEEEANNNKKKNNQKTASASSKSKPLSGMMQAYELQSADYDETLDLFKGSQKPRIEILQPKDKRDFEEFAAIMSDKILESANNEYYVHFLKLLLEKITAPLSTNAFSDLQDHVNNLATMKQSQKKEESKKDVQKELKSNIDDPFADIGGSAGGTAFDDDQDFM
jgi:FtsZ-interacting cell division protein YlmF